MTVSKRTRIIPIGNSQGVRIPKMLLEQAGLEGEVELEAEQGKLVIRAIRATRAGWSDQFATMAERGDDELMFAP